MYKCKYCNQEFDNLGKISGHTTWCNLNPNRSKNLENLQKVREDRKPSLKDIRQFNCPWCKENFNVNANQFANHHRWCDLNPNRKRPKSPKDIGPKLPRKHSAETRKLLSEKRKAYLAANKGKHPWSRYSNSESKPEKNFRLFAEKTNIPLVQYYIPPESDRFFEMDFANLEHKICFEINGNQHYLEDRKTLAPYYQERHNHFTSLGWKVLEIHYSLLFKDSNIDAILKESFIDFEKCEEKLQEIVNGRIERKNKKKYVRKKSEKVEVDFSKKLLTQKEINYFLKNRKVTRPTKEELHQMLWSMPSTKIALHFGVSDKCIEKWAKGYGLSKPPRGHWAKEKANK